MLWFAVGPIPLSKNYLKFFFLEIDLGGTKFAGAATSCPVYNIKMTLSTDIPHDGQDPILCNISLAFL